MINNFTRSECDENGRRITPSEGECCGEKMSLGNFTNTCRNCGADYNSAGQLLAPREQWGEETGESLSDILSIDYTDTDDLLEGN